MKHPGAGRLKPERWRRLRFKVRNFVAGRVHRLKFDAALWVKVQARRRKAAKYDPVWKESWWCLEKRYTKLAKKYCKLELRYLKVRDELRRVRNREQARTDRSRA